MTNEAPAFGICLEEYEYPYPVQLFPLSNDLQLLTMAYMDVPPSTEPNGKTVVLIHGKAFGCYYFGTVIEALTGANTRNRMTPPDSVTSPSFPPQPLVISPAPPGW